MNIINLSGKKLPYYREYPIQCMFYHYQENLRNDMGAYRKYILYFISNENRLSTFYKCKNSYHRMLVHQFCESQGLIHKTGYVRDKEYSYKRHRYRNLRPRSTIYISKK